MKRKKMQRIVISVLALVMVLLMLLPMVADIFLY